jgi:hypothetical protein
MILSVSMRTESLSIDAVRVAGRRQTSEDLLDSIYGGCYLMSPRLERASTYRAIFTARHKQDWGVAKATGR